MISTRGTIFTQGGGAWPDDAACASIVFNAGTVMSFKSRAVKSRDANVFGKRFDADAVGPKPSSAAGRRAPARAPALPVGRAVQTFRFTGTHAPPRRPGGPRSGHWSAELRLELRLRLC